MNELFQWFNGLYILLVAAGMVGAFFAGRRGRNKEINDANMQLNETLEKEMSALRRRIGDLERDRTRQYDVIDTIRYALASENLKIVINGDFVSLMKPGAPNKITRIKSRRVPSSPLPATGGDDDDEDAI